MVFPHFLNQAPPGAQQLRLPPWNVPHLGHARLAVVVAMFVVGATVVVVAAVVSGAVVVTVVVAAVVAGGKSAGVDKL